MFSSHLHERFRIASAAAVGVGPEIGILEFFREFLGFEPDAVQAQVLLAHESSVILNCARQWGKSSLAAGLLLYEALFKPRSFSVVLSKAEAQSAELISRVKQFAVDIGVPLRRDGVRKCSLLFPNGSRIVGLPGTRAGSRGFSAVTFLLIDEAAFVPDRAYHIARPYLAMTRGRIWLLSTPAGTLGFFCKEWKSESTRWRRFEVKATDCDRYDAEFLAGELEALGEARFAQEYCCEFRGKGATLFDRDLLRRAVVKDGGRWAF